MIEIAGIGILSAFLAGLVSFLSPCVLPLVPGYVSYVAGRSLDDLVNPRESGRRLEVLALSLCFVLGFSAVFIALGASASAAGRLLGGFRYQASYVAGAIIVLFGLHLMGAFRFGWMDRTWHLPIAVRGGRPLGTFLLGTAFAFGWTPCIGPILGAILTVSATSAGVASGVVLLAVYSAGLAVPFLAVALFIGGFVKSMNVLRRIGPPLQKIAGAVLVAVGIAMVTGYLTSAGTWLLLNFPFFQGILL